MPVVSPWMNVVIGFVLNVYNIKRMRKWNAFIPFEQPLEMGFFPHTP